MHRNFASIVIILSLFALTACPSQQTGIIEGTITPPSSGVRITAVRSGGETGSTTADPQTGAFKLTVAPGQYDVSITVPSSPFPLSFSAVIIEPGQTRSLGTIQLPSIAGHASLAGRIAAGGEASRVSLTRDGIERASVMTDAAGHYDLRELPAGSYLVHTAAANYADDSRSVVLTEGQRSEVNMRMIYREALDGIDWSQGTLTVRGIGVPPPQAPTPTVRRELAKRAALADAQRNLLRIIELIKVGPDEHLTALLGKGADTRKLSGFLQGYRITADRDLDAGKVEVEIQIPLTGPGGLSSYLPAN